MGLWCKPERAPGSCLVPVPRASERTMAGEAVLCGRGDESRFQRWRWRCGFPGAMPQAGMRMRLWRSAETHSALAVVPACSRRQRRPLIPAWGSAPGASSAHAPAPTARFIHRRPVSPKHRAHRIRPRISPAPGRTSDENHAVILSGARLCAAQSKSRVCETAPGRRRAAQS